MREPGDGDEDETFDESDSIDDAERVVIQDEDGKEHTLIVVAVVEVDGKDYAMLVEEDEEGAEVAEGDEDEDEETPVYLFTYEEDDEGNATLGEIEDESVYDEVFKVCATLMDLEEGEEDEPEA